MKIGIHHSKGSFSEGWIKYCEKNGIGFKLVDPYANNIVAQLDDCDAFMWHFTQVNSKDVIFAKHLLMSLHSGGKKIFPDINSVWHFDSKIAQKYLFEALDIPLVPTHIFYSKSEALEWAENTEYPKVFKLSVGAGSSNVQIVKTKAYAKKTHKKGLFIRIHECGLFANSKG